MRSRTGDGHPPYKLWHTINLPPYMKDPCSFCCYALTPHWAGNLSLAHISLSPPLLLNYSLPLLILQQTCKIFVHVLLHLPQNSSCSFPTASLYFPRTLVLSPCTRIQCSECGGGRLRRDIIFLPQCVLHG